MRTFASASVVAVIVTLFGGFALAPVGARHSAACRGRQSRGGHELCALTLGDTTLTLYLTPGHYRSSARKMKDIAAKAGADVLRSNHSNYDGSKTKLPH